MYPIFRQVLCLLSFVWLLPLAASAQEGSDLLQRLATTMRALGPYEASFTLESEGISIEGRYAVSGDRYQITLPTAAVWGEDALRYEVDHRRKTITLAPVDRASRNLLDNPTRAFDFAAADYRREQVAANAQEVRLKLTVPEDPLTTIYLTLDRLTCRPLVVRYEIDGIGLDLYIDRIAPLSEPLPAFTTAAYADYEVVDFR